jgi:hypothetical protein
MFADLNPEPNSVGRGGPYISSSFFPCCGRPHFSNASISALENGKYLYWIVFIWKGFLYLKKE